MAKAKEVVILFEEMAKQLNMPLTAKFESGKGYDRAFLKLDYAPIYGGYRIEVIQKSTGSNDFDGLSRKPKKEMIAYIRGVLKGLSSK
jgi:hypothetical protein